MDCSYRENEKENSERRNSNTEYQPTKCRITKPPPPKPATNPLQFVKVAPPPLFQKAQEQIKKVEEIRSVRREIKDDGEDWQQNLDNWKSSRRKRQEHIIERVVEVKKLTQEEQEKSTRKSKTFNEILEERSKRGHRLKLPFYREDGDDDHFSNYGISSTNTKTSQSEINTEGDSSNINDKNQFIDSRIDIELVKDQNENNMNKSNVKKKYDINRDFEDIVKSNTKDKIIFEDKSVEEDKVWLNTYKQNLYLNKPKMAPKSPLFDSKLSRDGAMDEGRSKESSDMDQYTYEGAIEGYRTRIRSKINVDESFFKRTTEDGKAIASDVDVLIPKGALFKRKEIFEADKPVEIGHMDSSMSRRLSEDFVNSQSIKERLKSLEKFTDQTLIISSETSSKIKSRNLSKGIPPKSTIAFFLDKPFNNPHMEHENGRNKLSKINDAEEVHRTDCPETELYMNKLNVFSKDLDTLLEKNNNRELDYVTISSDREDSGIHTADVSCSVSQADESVEDNDMFLSVGPGCIEDLSTEKIKEKIEDFENNIAHINISEKNREKNKNISDIVEKDVDPLDTCKIGGHSDKLPDENSSEDSLNNNKSYFQNDSFKDVKQNEPEINKAEDDGKFSCRSEYFLKANSFKSDYNSRSVISQTETFLEKIKEDASVNFRLELTMKLRNANANNFTAVKNVDYVDYVDCENNNNHDFPLLPLSLNKNAETELSTNFPLNFSTFPLAPPKSIEPPKEKPPPPPVFDHERHLEKPKEAHIKRLNSTKRIKKEIYVKRSSFLGLDELPIDNQIDSDFEMEKPPDINIFLQKESQLEKSLYVKLHGSISEIESQDSGLESERGRLSSDTWCSNGTSTHNRQDSEQTNSVTSEEDEMTKREREIIELVEKEERSKSGIAYSKENNLEGTSNSSPSDFHFQDYSNNLELENRFRHNHFPAANCENCNLMLSGTDSEVMKVEQELQQLEQEELQSRKEDNLFREVKAKIRNRNDQYSLESLNNVDAYICSSEKNYRKSLPDISQNLGLLPLKLCKSVTHIPTMHYDSALKSTHRKSMPDIKQIYGRPEMEHKKGGVPYPLEYCKSMPELQENLETQTKMTTVADHPVSKVGPMNFTKFSKSYPHEQRKQNNLTGLDYDESETVCLSDNIQKKAVKQLSRHGLHALSATPKPKHIPNDTWIQPKSTAGVKNYNEHWLFQEAELRRIQDQQKNHNLQNHQWPSRKEKHIPEPIIQTLTQRIQNRTSQSDRLHLSKRPQVPKLHKEYGHYSHITHPNKFRPEISACYSSPVPLEESQSKLSVSGKKKCSFCGMELGRGAAMIIESLCLFYHMECFKCCVCHVQLGDGLIGTDVRVRNQKLHCHNCYSSDDGVKFSCV